jgi:mannan endo-1,4-beta-mannosidase
VTGISPSRARGRFLVAGLALLQAVVGATVLIAHRSPGPPSDDVVRRGRLLELGGHAWRFTGVNAYQLATDYRYTAGCGDAVPDPNVLFSSLEPGSVVRLWAYQAFAVNPGRHVFDWRPLDRVVAAAKARGIHLVMVLSNQSGTCDDGQWHGSSWYVGGYRAHPDPSGGQPVIVSWWSWLHLVVSRYAASPAIAYWEPVNEPEASDCLPGYRGAGCYGHDVCPAGAALDLRHFFDVVGQEIRRLDRWHAIASGTLGGDQCGSGGPGGTDWVTVGASPGIDILTVHDYSTSYTVAASRALQQRARQAKVLRKPLVLEEIGREASPTPAGRCPTTQKRAALVTSYAEDLFRRNDIAGFLMWQWLAAAHPECSDTVSPGDPLLTSLGAVQQMLDG